MYYRIPKSIIGPAAHRSTVLSIVAVFYCLACKPQNVDTVHFQVLGVYPVKASEPCHLIEVSVAGAKATVDFGQITQDRPGRLRGNLQVPWMEQILSPEGDKVIAAPSVVSRNPELLRGDFRAVFFFHYLDRKLPLNTPFGEISLPEESQLPDRLAMIRYETP